MIFASIEGRKKKQKKPSLVAWSNSYTMHAGKRGYLARTKGLFLIKKHPSMSIQSYKIMSLDPPRRAMSTIPHISKWAKGKQKVRWIHILYVGSAWHMCLDKHVEVTRKLSASLARYICTGSSLLRGRIYLRHSIYNAKLFHGYWA
jgi:hypothetical protein